MVERVGFIGLGDMGWPMARNLCGGSFDVMVYDLSAELVEELQAEGARAASSTQDVGAHSQVVGVCVVDDAASETVVEQLLKGAAPDTVIAIHGTVSPDAIARMAERARRSQCHVIDAQITGGRPRALERQLRYMVGGEDEIVTRCRPVFETSAAEITHCGPVGMGSIAKICNNLVQFQAWMAYVEADLIATKAGLAREKLFEVLAWIMNDNARTFLSVRAALVENPENEMLKERFTSAMQLAQKDLSLAQELAKEQEVPVPGTDLARGHMAHLFGVDPQESA